MLYPRLLTCLGLSLGSALYASGCSGGDPSGPTIGSGARLQEIVSGLSSPLYLTVPPGDAARLFIVEKTGTIRILKDGVLLPDPFLDLSLRISNAGEQGLLGMAFYPDYATSGSFIVHFTDPAGNTTLSRFQASSSNPDIADPLTELVILTAAQPFANHNGGQVTFGPDGFLYLGLGDGGGGGDPNNRGQDLSDFLGSILRIDVRTSEPYAVPPDNPFLQSAVPEVWSYGLRNPWRFSFDRATGDLYIADVGEVGWEEVDISTPALGAGKGANYGWNIMEGTHCFLSSGCDQNGLTLPVLEYSHQEGCSIIGGYVYRGTAIPALQGHYLYADLCQRWVRSFRHADGAVTEQTEWPSLMPPGPVLSFGEDPLGELYILDESGRVSKIVPDP
jgi:glucose/arabinose dehydrogenase